MEQRSLGRNGPGVGCIGYGAMVLEGYYGPATDDEGLLVVQRAVDAGMTMIDTADAYGNGHNEQLVGRALRGRRDDAFIATKFGIVFRPDAPGAERPTGWGFSLRLNGKRDYVLDAVRSSLERLGTDRIDLLYMHFPDPATPIEETVGAMAETVRSGQVRFLGLSNVTADEVRRARKIHPIAAVQFEYSLWRREAEAELLPTLRELGIALVAWSPLGAGFLSGSVAPIGAGDFRAYNPKFAAGNLEHNSARYAPIVAVAKELGITPAQLSLAWLLHQGPDIIPIPGTRRVSRIAENASASTVRLGPDVLRRIDNVARPGTARGATLI